MRDEFVAVLLDAIEFLLTFSIVLLEDNCAVDDSSGQNVIEHDIGLFHLQKKTHSLYKVLYFSKVVSTSNRTRNVITLDL